MEERKNELLKYVNNDITLIPLIEHIVFLENTLDELRKLPFIKTHPNNPQKQKATPASKQYKEFLQQYNNCLKTLRKASGADDDNEESPLRKWVNSRLGKK